ncbi:Crp/Fnr family transcriptional regulator [Pedobacter helvus]|uniref:Crp/Fnr family transcriptional regulator n=1 Tax=Pedobacter helvus TaxID=2563444 RepID=A0ABW9JJZ3_9SPHI|nr:Crp/Fnr family transcriptional regulator [Pedobacter ureilyticus]
MNEALHLKLKHQLQQNGAVTPAAWLAIETCMQTKQVKYHDGFLYQAKGIAYVADGLLKEYNSQYRDRPAIVNFFNTNQFLFMDERPAQQFFRACVPTLIYYWNWEAIQQLWLQFPELIRIYRNLNVQYINQCQLRPFLLEEKSTEVKIQRFYAEYKANVPLLPKKDIANYLAINYNYFVRNYQKFL